MFNKCLIVNNLKINYYQSDNLEKENTLVFLPGWKSEARHFQNILKECNNFVALDLPGFGKSEKAEEIWSISDYANFLKDFLSKLDIKRPFLVGHSFGASVIIKYCSNFNNVKKIILIASAGIRRKGYKIILYKAIAKAFSIFFSLPLFNLIKSKVRSSFYKIIDSEDYLNAGDMKETYKKIISEDLQTDIKKIEVATVIIWGENDKITPLADGVLINKLIKNSKLRIIKNAGHFVFIDQLEEFKKIFFNEIRG